MTKLLNEPGNEVHLGHITLKHYKDKCSVTTCEIGSSTDLAELELNDEGEHYMFHICQSCAIELVKVNFGDIK